MFNTMTLTKAAGALIGALLFLMLANWAAGSLYHVGSTHHGEGEEVAHRGDDADNAIEADNNEFNNNLLPRANPQIYNMTICGDPDRDGDEHRPGHRRDHRPSSTRRTGRDRHV